MSRPSTATNDHAQWTFGGLAIATDNASLWATQAAADDPADTSAPQVQATLADVEGDLVVSIAVPAGLSFVANVDDGVIQITMANIHADCCQRCGEHFSDPHAPECEIGAAEETALAAQDDTAMLAALEARAERRLR
ncbi:CHAP domain-containing protein [Gordonia aquimaris]|uniref:CHAP domain-containing protein n=1 Tax=Gordonia aquimaris TaxID=2984863 RepID=A0A9X3D7C3_9ACTN|nr:CHAP domain-containing protein [Gordonia aquimaris]MCX2966233.1 CHAP domain-containing protein [Gordonia aquimaris]